MQRVLIIGSGGAGKSTFAKRLGNITGLPVVHLDSLYWKPNWIPTPKDEWEITLDAVIKKDKWIMDGTNGETFSEKINIADTIIYLRINRLVCLFQALKRNVHKKRIDEIKGCKEGLNYDFLKWIWKYPKKNDPMIMKALEDLKGKKEVIIFKNRKEQNDYLRSLQFKI